MADTKMTQKAKPKAKAPEQAPAGNLPAVVRQQMHSFMAEFKARERAYAPLLPPHLPFTKFEASVRAAVAKDPELVTKCNHATLFRACAEAAELGLSLSPTLREADILKVWNKKLNDGKGGFEAQFRPRFIGLMKLARQSGEIDDIDAHEVYEWDEFDYEYGLNKRLIHKPAPKPSGYDQKPNWGIIAAYCIWEIGGKKSFEVMELEDLLRIMRRTSSKKQDGTIVGPWVTDKPEMCRKTVVRRSSKYMPLSAENLKRFAAAVNLDDKREGGEDVTIEHGEVVDITDGEIIEGESTDITESDEGTDQMDDLERRMTSAPPVPPRQQPPSKPRQQEPAKPQPVVKLDVIRVNGRIDWLGWIKLAEQAVKGLDSNGRAEWRKLHAAELDQCEFSVPGDMGELMKMLP
jgi:recombination protein RecT